MPLQPRENEYHPIIALKAVKFIITRLVIILSFCFWINFPASARADQKLQVNISYPQNESLIRANVPIFGTAFSPQNNSEFRRWYLEYGSGRSPTQWTRLKESNQPITYDPNTQREVVWNVNKEPAGNLTNWAVGLTSYKYASWGKNLNGIYTLRLIAETDTGQTAECRRTYFVGEAMIRLYGGTGISADAKCRLSVPSFSFGGDQSRIVAIIKQMPPRDMGRCKTVMGVEETDKSAAEIYTTTPGEFQLYSAIYRVYPTGLKTDPASRLEIDSDPDEFVTPNARSNSTDGVTLYQWNPVTRLWMPLKTEWFGNTAKGDIQCLSDYVTYVALMKRVRPISPPAVSWQEISALSGYWMGKTSPFTTITITSQDGRSSKCESDENGTFRLYFRLNPGYNPYRIEFMPLEGRAFARTIDVIQKSGGVATSIAPTLRVLGDQVISVNNKMVILCQDLSLSDVNVKEKRSIIAQIQTSDFSKKFAVELGETVAGMGNFIGCVLPQDSRNFPESAATTCFPSHLAEGTRLIISVGAATLTLQVKDTAPPRISLSSPTHPCLLFSTPETGKGLKSVQLHSQCTVTATNNAWKLSGIDGPPSARVTNWPVSSYSVASWPFVGFSYKLYYQAPWQLILRGDQQICSFRFACSKSWFDEYAPTDALVADGNWHYWQRNFTEGKFSQIDSISFGSWIKTGFLRVEAGFSDPKRDAIFIKNLWIGRSYPDRLVEINWHIEDDSPLGQIDWWVDQDEESATQKKAAVKTLSGTVPPDGKCSFRLPDDGKWFFHIRAADIAGNASPVMNYPLIVFSTMGKSQAAAERMLNGATAQEVTWNQPAGSFQIKLDGFGASLNPNTLALRFDSAVYRLSKFNWDSSSEILTVSADSFGTSVPLGFDKETLSATIEASDMAGKPISNLPALKILINSPFSWRPTDAGGILKPLTYNPRYQWIAFWKNPIPPWMNAFPNCVNNILVLTTGGDKGYKKQPAALHWEKPLQFVADGVQNIYFEENWDNPISKKIPVNSTADKQIFSFDGSDVTIPGRFPSHNPDKNAWVYAQSPTDPFAAGTLRMATRPKDGQTAISRVSKAEGIAALNKQVKNLIRFDGWLAPGKGFVYLKAPGKREIQYALGSDSVYRFVSGPEVRIDALSEWTKFVILISPTHNYKTTGEATLNGEYYW